VARQATPATEPSSHHTAASVLPPAPGEGGIVWRIMGAMDPVREARPPGSCSRRRGTGETLDPYRVYERFRRSWPRRSARRRRRLLVRAGRGLIRASTRGSTVTARPGDLPAVPAQGDGRDAERGDRTVARCSRTTSRPASRTPARTTTSTRRVDEEGARARAARRRRR
jgi:hypothetical protein